ncbi:MAG: Rrf2 family transcriptional regulator [Rhodoferax sp.]|jgi:Rrf2 family protein|nr:Rrf2 family transcriptional regulator [Rhodoferax sp.]
MINKQAKHALHIVLVVASLPAGETITTQALSARLGLSVSYLEGVLKQLRNTPVLRALRGPGGGYQLAGDPASISVWDVLSAFSEPAGRQTTPRLSATQWLDAECDRIKTEFLAQATIADYLPAVPAAPQEGARTRRRDSVLRFKPLAPPLRPRAPNSVFDLSSFLQLQAA